MLQWWIEQLRNRQADQARAVRRVQETAQATFREAVREYDAFVPHAQAVSGGLLLGTATSSVGETVRIQLPWQEVASHHLVQGGTGSGKTTWVTSLLLQALKANQPCGILDCKGDLFEAAIKWTAVLAQTLSPSERAALLSRLVVINPFAESLVPLNICRTLPGCSLEVQAYELTLALSRLFDASLGVHQENLLRSLLLLLAESGLSLAEAPQIMQDELLRGILAQRSTVPALKEFFLGAYPAIPQVSKDALLNRLQGLLLAENFRLMLGAEELVDLQGILNRGDPLFVFLGKGPGVPEEQVEILGNLLVQLLFQATYARGSNRQRPYLLALDEYFHLLDAPGLARRFETALTTARSYGLSLLLIHHNFAQLPPTLREIILGNTDGIALFRTSARNAEFFGDFLPQIDPELVAEAWAKGEAELPRTELRRQQLEALQRLPDRSLFWYDRRKPYRAVKLRVPDLPAPHEVAGISPQALEELIREQGWDRGGLALPRAELQTQIEARQRRLRELVRPPIQISQSRECDDAGSESPKKKRRPKLG